MSAVPLRDGEITCVSLIDLYMADYAGRDPTRLSRLTWWTRQIGTLRLVDVGDDEIHAALEQLATQQARYFAGVDADGKGIQKAKRKPISPATVNRYSASIAAVFTWAIRRRIAPKGWVHPCRGVERRPEASGRTRFLDDDERARLLIACRASTWPKLYALALMALTTGARKGELLGLRWSDIDLERAIARVDRTKNGDPKVLPLVAAVVTELATHASSPGSLVFCSRLRADRPFDFGPRWEAALAAAKIKDFRFHDLRHSCASLLARSGATLLEIGDLLGHRQLQMTKRYSHLATSHKAALVQRVLGDIG